MSLRCLGQLLPELTIFMTLLRDSRPNKPLSHRFQTTQLVYVLQLAADFESAPRHALHDSGLRGH